MPSKIKSFNFANCQHLRKLLISEQVEFSENIDLTSTPINQKNNVYADVDPKFKNLPDGITARQDYFSRIKLKTITQEIPTQTENINLDSTNFTPQDQEIINLMDDSLFWYTDFKEKGRKSFLKQRVQELQNKYKNATSDDIKLLAEHIILIAGKILENAEYFDELGNIKTKTPKKTSWVAFHKWLTTNILESSGDQYIFRSVLDISYSELNPNNISANALNRFMNSLEATIDKDGSKFHLFPPYDKDWIFTDYFPDTKRIGYKTEAKAIGGSSMTELEKLFKWWKEKEGN